MSAGTITGIRRAVNQRMRHTCTVVRPSGAHSWDSEGTDAAGVGYACHYSARTSRETNDGGQRLVVTETVMFPVGTDIQSTDRITAVVDQLGSSLITEARSIDGVPLRFPSHVSVLLTGSGA